MAGPGSQKNKVRIECVLFRAENAFHIITLYCRCIKLGGERGGVLERSIEINEVGMPLVFLFLLLMWWVCSMGQRNDESKYYITIFRMMLDALIPTYLLNMTSGWLEFKDLSVYIYMVYQ